MPRAALGKDVHLDGGERPVRSRNRRGADGLTIFLVEQNAILALEIAHRGYVMETGHIVLEGDAKVLMKDPNVRNAYLGI